MKYRFRITSFTHITLLYARAAVDTVSTRKRRQRLHNHVRVIQSSKRKASTKENKNSINMFLWHNQEPVRRASSTVCQTKKEKKTPYSCPSCTKKMLKGKHQLKSLHMELEKKSRLHNCVFVSHFKQLKALTFFLRSNQSQQIFNRKFQIWNAGLHNHIFHTHSCSSDET